MRLLLDHAGLVVEPSAALGIAAILEDRDRFADLHAYHRWVGAAHPYEPDWRSSSLVEHCLRQRSRHTSRVGDS